MFILDAHLDLAMNAMEWNRDLTCTVQEIRQSETGMTDKPDRTRGTVSLPEMRRGRIGLCVATLIARYSKAGNILPGWNSPEQAWAQTQGQLSWYRAMEERGEMIQIKDRTSLADHLDLWASGPVEDKPIGYILSLEGADSIITPKHLEKSYAQGLRALGPAHYGPGTYAQGTNATGGIGSQGKELLKVMEELNIILDATHLCDDSFWEALEFYKGPVWASHSNCRTLVSHNRQFSDEQLNVLIEKKAVIGMPLDAWMMIPNWQRGTSTPENMGLSLNHMVDHMDHICQLAGNSLHVGLGTDLDGGFGKEQCPADLDTIADLQILPQVLAQRGYTETDILNIMHDNFIRFLQAAWT
ncbi:MAG: dipeptidase [Bacteroidia bacterium]|nr:dipeptidase [Bacteroidia bacterium]